VWYQVSTAVNVGEPLFQLRWTEDLLCRVPRDAKGIYSFEMCGLTFEGATLSFYIKPAEGKELPDIMPWTINKVHCGLPRMERRVNEMKAAGIATEFHLYRNAGYGFALGTDASAESRIADAVRFWGRHIPSYGMDIIPDEPETIPKEALIYSIENKSVLL
jgi:hypothetical protein